MDPKIRPKTANRLKSSAQGHPEGAQKCRPKKYQKIDASKAARPSKSLGDPAPILPQTPS